MKKNFKTRGKSILRCKKPTPEVEIPPKYEQIADNAFAGDSVIRNVIIPGTVRDINFGAFESASALETVTFPVAGMVNLRKCGFMNCSNLARIENMSIIISYGDKAFKGCAKLADCDINPFLGEFGKSCFEGCKKIRSVKLPADHDTLPSRTFWGCDELSTVEFGAAMKNIGDGAFSSCVSLKKLDLPEAIETVGRSAFEDCYSIPNVKFGPNLKKIGKNAFKNCLYLNKVEFSEVVCKKARIERGAFTGCVELRTIIIPNGKWSISTSAFKKCKLHSADPLTVVCYNEDTADCLTKCLSALIKKNHVEIVLKDAPGSSDDDECQLKCCI